MEILKKIFIYTMVLIIISPNIFGEECKSISEPRDIPCEVTTTWVYPNACNTYTAILYNSTPINVENYTLSSFATYCQFTFNHSTLGTYYFNITSGDSGSILVEGEDEMAGIAVTIFILFLTFGVFALPFIVKSFSKNKYVDACLKGCCIIFGLFLTSLDIAMVMTISDIAGLGLVKEFGTYLFIVTWAIYASIVFVVVAFTFRMLKTWQIDKKNRNMGEKEDEE